MITTSTPIMRLFFSHSGKRVPWRSSFTWSRVGGSLNQNGAVSRL